MALCLEMGHGCEENLQEALVWYEKAAKKGNAKAKANINRVKRAMAQNSGCLLPILFTLLIIGLIAVL